LILLVVGARPNFIKMAPVIDEIIRRKIPILVVHTGQHYDEKMSSIFFDQLEMPRPHISLGIGSGTQADQTARIMIAFERVCLEAKPSLVIVGGDVNSTLACALTASKLGIPVAHVESGLRSFDRTMPEEINRVLTDHLSDILFTTEVSGNNNLLREGIAPAMIHFVGNTMIDSLHRFIDKALLLEPWLNYGIKPYEYGLVTFHRPSNVDELERAKLLASVLDEIGKRLPLLFPMHPRTQNQHQGLWGAIQNIKIVEPLGYLEFLGLMARAQVVITDSGGIQEETTVLGVRCLTVRKNTERPVTISQGTNQLVDLDVQQIMDAMSKPIEKSLGKPPLWDGRAAYRLAEIIEEWYSVH
jgi:UDP-N-acetylglucosamine 2-epimerase (non-hydrolysing)